MQGRDVPRAARHVGSMFGNFQVVCGDDVDRAGEL
jgi:hypothetical protein